MSEDPDAHFYMGINVSDRLDDWEQNYRCPKLAVYLPNTRATNRHSHWFGGPDFAVEIMCPNDRARQKLSFYASVNTRELLVIDRQPWSLELYRLREGRLVSEGPVAPGDDLIASDVLPISLRLIDGSPRPTIEIRHHDGRIWTV